MSIIIPSYNNEKEIGFVLASIQSQDLSQLEKSKIQVIVIDDRSKNNLEEIITKLNIKFDFDLQIIRLFKNMDLSFGRNIGVSASRNEILLFIDSDVLLSKNYLYEHNIRNQLISNAVFVSLRKNIKNESEILDYEFIGKGLENPQDLDDGRILNFPKKDQIGWETNFDPDRRLEILDDSNYFKNLGKGAKIGIYDLPGVLSGHNFSLNKNIFYKIGGFDTTFKGWGLEDKFFGVKAVCFGNFIIPVMSVSVFHINYGPRDGDMERKKIELKKNSDTFNKLLNQKWNK